MKTLLAWLPGFLLAILLMDLHAQSALPALTSIRQQFYKASESEDDADALFELAQQFNEQNPVYYGYRAMADMLQAKYSYNPFSKLKYFNKGKERLQQAISLAPENVELRFLRFAVQAKAPSLLGYKDQVGEDKSILLSFVERNRKQAEDPDLVARIVKFLRECELCTAEERARLSTM